MARYAQFGVGSPDPGSDTAFPPAGDGLAEPRPAAPDTAPDHAEPHSHLDPGPDSHRDPDSHLGPGPDSHRDPGSHLGPDSDRPVIAGLVDVRFATTTDPAARESADLSGPTAAPTSPPPAADPDSGPTESFARAWAAALSAAAATPLGFEHSLRVVTPLAEQVVAAPDDPELARKIGVQAAGALIDAHCFQGACVATSIEVIDRHLPPYLRPETRSALRAGLASAFAEGLRERTRAEQASIHEAVLTAYRAGEARFRTVFRNAALGIVITDKHGQVLEVNPALAEMLGVDAYAARGRTIRNLIDPTEPGEYWRGYNALLAGEQTEAEADTRIRRLDGGVVWTHVRTTAVRDDGGDVALVIALHEDVTERRRATDQLRHQATHDALTGLPNRVRLLDAVEELLRSAGPEDRLGLCFLDLDGFKGVNDTLGHQAGDELLTEIAHRLSAATDPRRHVVARMGGDEFVILFRRTQGPQSVFPVIENVLDAVRQPVLLDGHSVTVTASAGLVERPAAGAEATELLRAADITLYWAKSAGKADFALFDEDRNAREVHRYALAQALPAALESGEMFLDYQPIVDLSGGRPPAVEALVRWRHPERGLLKPEEFIPVAEETGAIVELGRWVLDRAVHDAASWPDGPAVAVNVAVRQVHDYNLVREVAAALEASGLPPRRLCLEITETALMDTEDAGLPGPGPAALRTLADMGIGIAVDDFGTGYSNLARLRDLPATSLKIDASFVADLGSQAGGFAESVITSLVALAHAAGMTVTAEGIETGDQARRLTALGVDFGQGFYYSRPVPAARIAAVLERLAAGVQ
ncbi:diguanylate cyclase (GGDEF)-like protein/PAS domain S-box-containing protein [Catenulispora sp. GP43]|uniref:putative bifunctional diguanylate cyclase/phosphodiesterase n=1 Tax=Catenulispora sp. GP43 TaxID=3156263 RepID=UPI00351304A8